MLVPANSDGGQDGDASLTIGIGGSGGVFALSLFTGAIASVMEMTGNYALLLPVMLAAGIATGLARELSGGTICTRKLLRRGIDLDLLSGVTTMPGTGAPSPGGRR
jgi:chloride channel protein, CIC family